MLGCRLPGQIWEQVGGRGALKKCYELSTLLHYRMCCVCVYVVTCIIMCINCSYSRSKAARRRLKKALTSIRFISSLRWAMFNQVTPCKIVECHANKEINTILYHAFVHPWYLWYQTHFGWKTWANFNINTNANWTPTDRVQQTDERYQIYHLLVSFSCW